MSTGGSSKTIPLDSQVGGHPGVLTSEDGSLLIKPAHPTEVAFYQSVVADPGFAPLRPFVPKFYGTLRLEGRVDEAAAAADEIGGIKVVEVTTEVEKDEYMRFVSPRSPAVYGSRGLPVTGDACTVPSAGEPLARLRETEHPRHQAGNGAVWR